MLYAKKEAMMEQLNEKMNEFKLKILEFKKQIYMLKTEIYSIRCFAGETVELLQIRSGKSESIDTPIVLNQKILYLDEDLAKTMSIYGDVIDHNYKILEEALKYNDTVMEIFCPQPKSVSFFRCSKDNKSYIYNTNIALLQSYDMLHGNKMGFVVRNGENLYVGWLESDWDDDNTDKDKHELTFEDSVIYKADIKTITDKKDDKDTPIDHKVSRLFALSVLQGLIENKNIITLPENVKINVPGKYVIHNYADAWLEDNRFGDFSTLINNLHIYNKVGDIILIISKLREMGQNSYDAHRSRGERNTTRDCKVESGLNRINLIEGDKIFISAKKDDYGWLDRKNGANFEIQQDEFINLTFMNSVWLKYYIDTKKIGEFGRSVDYRGISNSLSYSYLIKYFKIAYDHIIHRENVEANWISKYVDLDNYSNWKELLSYWKIKNDVHSFSEYQAKRFAKYLLSNDHYMIKNLFIKNTNEVEHFDLDYRYFTTLLGNIGRKSSYVENKDNPKFGWTDNSCDIKFDENSSLEDIKAREEFDIEKELFIRNSIIEYGLNYNVDIKSNKHFLKICSFNKFIEYDDKNSKHMTNYAELFFNYIKSKGCNYKYEDFEEIFINDILNDNYYWWKQTDPRLYKLLWVVYMQQYIYPFMVYCIEKTVKYNYGHEITIYEEN